MEKHIQRRASVGVARAFLSASCGLVALVLVNAGVTPVAEADPPGHDWGGFYVSVNGGGAFGTSTLMPQQNPATTVTTTTPGTAGGCSAGGTISPITLTNVLAPALTAFPTLTNGPAPPAYNGVPGLFQLVSADNGPLSLVPNGAPVANSFTVVPGQTVDFQVQPLATQAGAAAKAFTTIFSSTTCEVVNSAGALVGDPLGLEGIVSGVNGKVVPGVLGTTTTTTALTGPLAAGQVNPATLAALTTLQGQQFNLHTSGFMGGGNFGYAFNLNQWVVGPELEFDAGSVSGSQSVGSFTARGNLEWYGAASVKIGYPYENFLFYGAAGLAFGQTGLTYAVPGASVTQHQVQTGGTFGGGLEYALSDRWGLRADYRFIDLGSATFLSQYGYAARVGTMTHVTTLGVTYHF